MKELVLVLAVASYSLSALGTLVIFRIEGKEPLAMRGVKVLAVLGSFLSVYAIAAAPAAPDWAAAATVLYTAAIMLFLWAARTNWQRPLSIAFSSDEPEHLVTTGPYRLIRHPFYTSYLLAYAAALVASRTLWLTPIPIIMGLVYVTAARFEERKFAGSALASEFAAYKQRAGLFWPRPVALKSACRG